ncbi:MAG: hypothetical protein U0U09_18640 [Cyclobacteriaceae bacterium]
MDLYRLASRIFNYGQLVEMIEYYNRRVALYSVDSDFYEVYYNQESNEIEKINQASDPDLAKYLNRITIKL